MTSEFERREFTRVPLNFPVTLEAEGMTIKSNSARDVSAKGLFVESPAAVSVGADATIRIDLVPGSEDPVIKALGRIARVDENGIGVEFTDIDLQSFEQLKNLVRFYTNDPDRVDREFQEHLSILRK